VTAFLPGLLEQLTHGKNAMEVQVTRVQEISRTWTPEQEEQLFDIYFSSGPGICPVCAHEVCMMLTQLGRTVTILLSCTGCGNKASVNRQLPVQRHACRTDEDESGWA
jgi:hypothetical protein